MQNFDARTVFFVKDAERALSFDTQTLGFKQDWIYQARREDTGRYHTL